MSVMAGNIKKTTKKSQKNLSNTWINLISSQSSPRNVQ